MKQEIRMKMHIAAGRKIARHVVESLVRSHGSSLVESLESRRLMATLTTLATFNITNGALPFAGLNADAGGNLYGTTAYGGANGAGAIVRGGGIVGGRAGAVLIEAEVGRGGVGEQLGAAAAGPQSIDGPVAGESEDPRKGGAAAGLEGAGLLPDGDKRVVNDILGLGGVTQNPKGGGVKRAGKSVVEFGKRGPITGGHAVKQPGVGQVPIVGVLGET